MGKQLDKFLNNQSRVVDKVLEKPLDNPQHEEFVRLYALTQSMGKAYRASYPDSKESSASASASRLLQNVKIRQRYELLCEKYKEVTKDAAIRKFSEALNAKKTIAIAEGTKLVQVDDMPTQLRTAVELAKIHDMYPKGPGFSVNVDNSQDKRKQSININGSEQQQVSLELELKVIRELQALNESLGLCEGEQTGEIIDIQPQDVVVDPLDNGE